MTRFITNAKIKKIILAVVPAIFWIVVWHIAYLKVAQELLLVSPAQAFMRFFELSREALFWSSVINTCLRVLAGFFLALLVGTLLAAFSASFRIINALITPLLGVVKATPVASFIILTLLWIKTDNLPVFIAFLMVVPMIWSNIFAGIKNTDKDLLEMAQIFKLSKNKIFSAIYIPAVMPYFVSACSVGLGFAWKSAIAAEIICLPQMAIGKQIYNSKIYLETADLFAWTIAVIILSVLIEKLTMLALNRITKRLYTTTGKSDANA